MQKVQVKNWGNSQAIRIPKNILEALNLDVDSLLEITVDKENKSIVLKMDDELTPYQKLMLKGSKTKERKQIVWDRLEEKEGFYS
ncbi:AbrB/MazE/SpoVT family DNA-binding domain-containing protein [Metabacillus halosaccharovorans]|uniref:AbrB/MazE/SpoVT family DNA-binding domain-containing protein n=1 Tax=Metabacillus halosaccharovorans TaxID=930124 RepID=A0ABT3DIZ5_9BACI|nr:AbrB/MazE/SpoVT family DNA-binding domain-containing protein [Metabacillus halosaccharovorans]MCV9887028.1 AbrB/MazE/SpoVT family DNA-binding domain-containing protein [Metabacillus halosaccharovorans]